MSEQQRYYRKVFRITAEQSPNVRLALAEIAAGRRPSHTEIVPGVVSYAEYRKRRLTWDQIMQCIGLDAQFYQGSELLLYPPLWLNRCNEIHTKNGKGIRSSNLPRSIGIDPAEGGDKTSMVCTNALGILEIASKATPDTSIIPDEAIAFMRKWDVPPSRVGIDRGGGGKQAADTMRRRGYKVRTIAFGEAVSLELKRGLHQLEARKDVHEERYAYINRRAQMYGELRLHLDPSLNETGFGISSDYVTLRQEMAPIPLTYDPEGRLRIPAKHKRNPDSEEVTLTSLIGHSPDELDALVISLHVLLHKPNRIKAGVF